MRINGTTLSSAAHRTLGLAAVAGTALALASPAVAYDTAPGWIASDYATGFKHLPGGEVGPAGLVFDKNANLLVTDPADNGALYSIPPGGGAAAGNKLLDGHGVAAGLAFDLSGHLYLARRDKQDVVEIDPGDGHYIRTVASGQSCPVGLATDPVSGDLFVSNNFCPGGGIMRLHSDGSATRYAPSGVDADGLTFAPDGTLFAAAGNKVVRIEGTGSANPGKTTDIGAVPKVDGIAYAPATERDDAYLVVNRNDGEIDRLDLNGNLTALVRGTSRGDFVTVGPDRCVYATLQDRVIKLGPATGLCFFAPTTGGGNGGGVLGETFRSTQQARVADTAVAGSAPKNVGFGSRFTYKLTVRNGGPGIAHNVVLTDKLAKGVRFVSAHASSKKVACSHKGRSVTCRKATLPRGASFKVKLVVRAVRGAKYVNRVSVRSKDLDPAPGNNKRRQTTRVKASSSSVLGVQRHGGSLPRLAG